jgi:hypothetical protein
MSCPAARLRVARVALLGTEAEPLHRAGPHPLDQHVGPLDEVEHDLHRLGALEVEGDARPAAVEQVLVARGQRDAARPVDPDDVGAEVGEHHARVRARPDPRDLDHPHAPQRPAPLPQLVRHAPDDDSTAVVVARCVSRGGDPPHLATRCIGDADCRPWHSSTPSSSR